MSSKITQKRRKKETPAKNKNAHQGEEESSLGIDLVLAPLERACSLAPASRLTSNVFAISLALFLLLGVLFIFLLTLLESHDQAYDLLYVCIERETSLTGAVVDIAL